MAVASAEIPPLICSFATFARSDKPNQSVIGTLGHATMLSFPSLSLKNPVIALIFKLLLIIRPSKLCHFLFVWLPDTCKIRFIWYFNLMVKPNGIEIEPFIRPIERVAEAYSDFKTPAQDGLLIPPLEMDADALTDLRRVNDDSPFPLISSSVLKVGGDKAGEFHVVAIGPEQLVGDLTTSPRDHEGFSAGAGASGVIPTLGESTIHIPISTHRPAGMPYSFVNNLDLVSIGGGQMSRLGMLGQPYYRFLSIVKNGWFAEVKQPEASFTAAPNLNGSAPSSPNAVYNPHPRQVQVSGFLALDAWLSDQHSAFLENFAALPPRA